jgi:hypothetical protein
MSEHLMNLIQAIESYTAMVATRARNKGYAAYQDGADCHAPASFGEYSGAWVEGWSAAMLDTLAAPATPMAIAAA